MRHFRDVVVVTGLWLVILGSAVAVGAVDFGLRAQLFAYEGFGIRAFAVILVAGVVLVAAAFATHGRAGTRVRRGDWL